MSGILKIAIFDFVFVSGYKQSISLELKFSSTLFLDRLVVDLIFLF